STSNRPCRSSSSAPLRSLGGFRLRASVARSGSGQRCWWTSKVVVLQPDPSAGGDRTGADEVAHWLEVLRHRLARSAEGDEPAHEFVRAPRTGADRARLAKVDSLRGD